MTQLESTKVFLDNPHPPKTIFEVLFPKFDKGISRDIADSDLGREQDFSVGSTNAIIQLVVLSTE